MLETLLTHPAVQGGVAPFLVALIVVALFWRVHLSGLALIAGFITTVYMVNDYSLSFEPLTGERKIILLGLGASVVGVVLMQLRGEWARMLLTVVAGAAVIWVAQRILEQKESSEMLLWGAGCVLYVGWLTYWLDRLDPLREGTAGLGLGLGTGVAALFGGSAKFGQYGMALGAAAAAFLLLQMLMNRPLPGGRAFALPLAVVAGSSACYVVLTTSGLPWYVLPVLALIPVVTRIKPPVRAVWLQAVLLSVATLACAAVAVYLTWRVAGAPPV
jgi:hypothetical protein